MRTVKTLVQLVASTLLSICREARSKIPPLILATVAIAMIYSNSLALPRPSGKPTGHRVIDTALRYVGPIEKGNNDGPAVRKFLRHVGLPPGNPWCAAFVSYCLDAANAKLPTIRTALATGFLRGKYISAKKVYMGFATVPRGSIFVMRYGDTWKGHTGLVISSKGSELWTIEGNTSSGRKGSQRDGNGAWIRQRFILPFALNRIVGFVPTEL